MIGGLVGQFMLVVKNAICSLYLKLGLECGVVCCMPPKR